jgi:hypothetical protein
LSGKGVYQALERARGALLMLKPSARGVVNVEAKGFIMEQSQLMEKDLWPVLRGS